MRWLTVVLALACLGADQASALQVDWSAHAGCGDVDEYWRAVGARAPQIARAGPFAVARRVRIDIRAVGARSVGTIVVHGQPARTIAADTCTEVIDGLALVTVLIVDPSALTVSAASPAAASATPPSAPAAVPPPVTAPSPPSSSVTPAVAPTTSPHPIVDSGPAPTSAGGATSGLRVGGGLGVGLMSTGVHPVFRPSIMLELARERVGSLRLSGALSEPMTTGDGSRTTASFRWTTARLDGCAFGFGDDVVVRPCLGFELGTVRANGAGVESARAETRSWMAAHLLARAELRLGSAFLLDLEAGAAAPIVRDEFVIEPDHRLYRPPAVLPSARLSLSVFFP